MNRLMLKVILLCTLPLMLAGCGPSRKSVRSGGSGRITSTVATASHPGKQSGGGTPADGGRLLLDNLLCKVSDPMARDLIAEAGDWIGTQYVYGGSTRAGTDCSGLVMSVYRDVCGVKIPRTTRDQVRYCTQVARNQLRPGDLIFFGRGESADSVSHVGMYVGEGRMIHASSSRGVIVSSFDTGYWADRYTTGARVDSAPRSYASRSAPRKATTTLPSPPSPAPSPAPTPAPVQLTQSSQSSQISQSPQVSIDLLDLLISAKIDSITSAGAF